LYSHAYIYAGIRTHAYMQDIIQNSHTGWLTDGYIHTERHTYIQSHTIQAGRVTHTLRDTINKMHACRQTGTHQIHLCTYTLGL